MASKSTLMPALRIASRSTRPASASRDGVARASVSTRPPGRGANGGPVGRGGSGESGSEAAGGDVPRGAGRGDGPVGEKNPESLRGKKRAALGGELRREEARAEEDSVGIRVARVRVVRVD